MIKLKETTILEFKYETKEERDEHVRLMESQGFECTGQIKNQDNLYTHQGEYGLGIKPESYWYGKFIKVKQD